MADYSYKKADPNLSAAAIEAATGVVVGSSLATPEAVVVVSTVSALSGEDEGRIDQYMLDLGFVRVFP
jgi:hypothetical protein